MSKSTKKPLQGQEIVNKKEVIMTKAKIKKTASGTFVLEGKVLDHPRFEPDTFVITSSIKQIETRNTIYILK